MAIASLTWHLVRVVRSLVRPRMAAARSGVHDAADIRDGKGMNTLATRYRVRTVPVAKSCAGLPEGERAMVTPQLYDLRLA